MPTIQHTMKPLMADLDAKIKELEGYKGQVEAAVRDGYRLDVNTTALNQINDSLCAAKAARKVMMDSCCYVYSCEFNWESGGAAKP